MSASLALLLLISLVLLGVVIGHYHEKKITLPRIVFSGSICDWLHKERPGTRCGDLIGGGVSRSFVN